jgi:hypothetical protein
MITINQLDRELTDARPPSPPPDPAADVAWHQDNGLAVPDHLTTKSGLNTQEAGPSTEAAPAKLTGTHQPDTRPPPEPCTDIPMADAEDIVDWVPSP